MLASCFPLLTYGTCPLRQAQMQKEGTNDTMEGTSRAHRHTHTHTHTPLLSRELDTKSESKYDSCGTARHMPGGVEGTWDHTSQDTCMQHGSPSRTADRFGVVAYRLELPLCVGAWATALRAGRSRTCSRFGHFGWVPLPLPLPLVLPHLPERDKRAVRHRNRDPTSW